MAVFFFLAGVGGSAAPVPFDLEGEIFSPFRTAVTDLDASLGDVPLALRDHTITGEEETIGLSNPSDSVRVDLQFRPLDGTDADAALGAANITVNKNAVPNDPRSPFVTSGLRVGTPAITTRGFMEAETIELTGWMCDVLESLENGNSEQVIADVKVKVLEVCSRFPVYG